VFVVDDDESVRRSARKSRALGGVGRVATYATAQDFLAGSAERRGQLLRDWICNCLGFRASISSRRMADVISRFRSSSSPGTAMFQRRCGR